jgi:hypothetical protein
LSMKYVNNKKQYHKIYNSKQLMHM